MKKTNRSIKSLLLVGGVLFAQGIFAQEFTLQEAKDYAVANNAQAKNAGLDVQISQKKIWETTAIGLPQVDASLSYRNALDLEFDFPAAALQQPGNEFLSIFAADNITQGKVEATQLLFDGTYIVGLQAARTYAKLSEDAQAKTVNDVKAEVTSNYYLALVAQENIEILEGSFTNINQSIKETQALVEQGFVEATELDQLQLLASNMESSLNNARAAKSIAYKMLKLNMGLDINKEITLKDSLQGIMAQITIDALTTQQFDSTSNADLALLNTQKELLALDVKRYQWQRFPSLAAFYSYQNTAYQLDFDWYQDATWLDAQNLGIALNIPILSSGMQGAKIQQAKLELRKMENQMAYYSDALEIQFLNARNNLITKSTNLNNAQKSMSIAQTIYDRTYIKYTEGLASSFELTQIKNQLLEAQGQYINALFDLLNTKAEFDKLQSKL